MTQIFVRPCWGIVYRVLTVLMLTVCSFGSASAQQWETVKMYDFSDPAFGPQLGGVDGFSAAYYFLSGNGASGDAADPCGKSISLQGYIAMQQPLEAGVNYRLSVNAKTTNSFYWLGFYYSTFPSTQLGTVIDNYVQVDGVSTITDPGNDYVSSTFTVGTDGTYWLILRNQSGGSVILDNFTLERETGTANLPNFSLTMAGENDPVSEISMAPGGSAEICLTPDSAPATDMTLDVQVNGNTNPHFDGFSASLTFPAGSTAQQCVTLSPANTPDEASYDFEVVNSDGGETVAAFSVTVAPECTGVAGPDQMICEGESVELGTGCLPDPHPVDGVEYCYAWEPVDGLDDPAAVMPSASPTETTAYTVYVTSSEGELIVEEEVTVTVESFDFDITSTSQVLCQGESALLEVPDSYVEYSWIKDEEVIGDDHTVEVFSSGLYSIEITNSNGCTSTAEIYIAEVSDPLSVKELFEGKGFMKIPIEITGDLQLKTETAQTNRYTSVVDDCAEKVFVFTEDEDGGEVDIASIMDEFLLSDVLEVNIENKFGVVTSNNALCNTNQSEFCAIGGFDQIELELNNSELGYWVHLWQNPVPTENDYLFVLAKSQRTTADQQYAPVDEDHEEFITNMMKHVLNDDISTVSFVNKGERITHMVFDLLWQGSHAYVLSETSQNCDLEIRLKSAAPADAITISEMIDLIEEIEELYDPVEQRNTKLMITRIRRIFYNSEGWNTKIIPGSANPESQSPFGYPCSTERERIAVDGTWFNFDYVDIETYPCNTPTGERPEIYLNQEVKLETGMTSGDYIDIGHVFAGLDAFNHPGPLTKDIPFFGTLGAEHNYDAATWVGDLASSIAFAKIQYINNNSELLDACEYQTHIDRGAPPQDMLGNIDSYVISSFYPIGEMDNGPKVSEVFKNYYLGISTNSLSFDGVQLYQNNRFSIFANAIGITLNAQGEFTNKQDVVDRYKKELTDFAGIIISLQGEGFLDIPTSYPFGFGITRDKESGRFLMELFLEELSNCVQYE